jgi:MoaA/NifB/PqqE/SkfB family radical SAM enzyme
LKLDSSITLSSKAELSLVPKLYQQDIFPAIREHGFGQSETSGPLVVEFDPTTACNLGCPECISGSLLGAGGFSSSAIDDILASFVELGVKAVVLIGGGEPMMHPRIEHIINYLYENNIHIGITTNGLFIESHLDLVATKVSWLRVSVDASCDDTFRQVRPDKKGNSQFDALLKQMRLLGSYSGRTCTFGYSMLLLTRTNEKTGEVEFTNANEIYNAASLAKSLGCDYFEVKPSFDANHFHIMQPNHLMKEAKNQLECAQAELTSDSFRILTATNLFEILECNPTQQPKSYSQCPVTRLRTLVSPSGVFPCPYFRGDVTRSYGNPMHTSLKQIWNSEQMKDTLENLDPSRDCRFHCIRHNTNLELLSLAEKNLSELDDISLSSPYNRFF